MLSTNFRQKRNEKKTTTTTTGNKGDNPQIVYRLTSFIPDVSSPVRQQTKH